MCCYQHTGGFQSAALFFHVTMNIKRFILDLIYPTRCPCCHDFIRYNQDFCDKCKSDFTAFSKKIKIENCDFFYSLYVYDDKIRPAVITLKNGIGGNAPYAFAAGLYELIKSNEISADLICPVPMFRNDENMRGYNQCNLIAKELSAMSKITWSKKGLIKIKNTKPQKELNAAERAENLKGAFSADSAIIKGKKIILLDDVCTTGSTLKAASLELKNAGADCVCALICCKTDDIPQNL